jgi:DNA-binding protein YbaB
MATWDDAESSIARVREQMAETLARAERAQGLKDQIAAIRSHATSPKNEVTVEVDASGRLVGIVFNADAARLSPEELSRAVLRAVAGAQRKAGDQAIALTADIFGEDSETVAMIRGEVDERMPDLPADDSVGYQ